jgi:hypothetical protein
VIGTTSYDPGSAASCLVLEQRRFDLLTTTLKIRKVSAFSLRERTSDLPVPLERALTKYQPQLKWRSGLLPYVLRGHHR